MKTIINFIIGIIFLMNVGVANTSNYKLTLTNLNFTSQNTLEFDIYLLSTNTEQEELKYSLGQYFFEFNLKIANGGNLICSIVASDLPENMRPRNPSVADNLIRLAVNSVSVNKGTLPVIPNQEPGMLVARVKLETSADKFADNEQLNLKWTGEENKMRAKLTIFDGERSIEITNAKNHFFDIDNSGSVGIEDINFIPTEYSLGQNYPNPFNPTTNIQFDIPNQSNVKLAVYDLTGREVATLVNQELQTGRYEYKFDGSSLSSGMYFYKITAGSFTIVRKMVLIK